MLFDLFGTVPDSPAPPPPSPPPEEPPVQSLVDVADSPVLKPLPQLTLPQPPRAPPAPAPSPAPAPLPQAQPTTFAMTTTMLNGDAKPGRRESKGFRY